MDSTVPTDSIHLLRIKLFQFTCPSETANANGPPKRRPLTLARRRAEDKEVVQSCERKAVSWVPDREAYRGELLIPFQEGDSYETLREGLCRRLTRYLVHHSADTTSRSSTSPPTSSGEPSVPVVLVLCLFDGRTLPFHLSTDSNVSKYEGSVESSSVRSASQDFVRHSLERTSLIDPDLECVTCVFGTFVLWEAPSLFTNEKKSSRIRHVTSVSPLKWPFEQRQSVRDDTTGHHTLLRWHLTVSTGTPCASERTEASISLRVPVRPEESVEETVLRPLGQRRAVEVLFLRDPVTGARILPCERSAAIALYLPQLRVEGVRHTRAEAPSERRGSKGENSAATEPFPPTHSFSSKPPQFMWSRNTNARSSFVEEGTVISFSEASTTHWREDHAERDFMEEETGSFRVRVSSDGSSASSGHAGIPLWSQTSPSSLPTTAPPSPPRTRAATKATTKDKRAPDNTSTTRRKRQRENVTCAKSSIRLTSTPSSGDLEGEVEGTEGELMQRTSPSLFHQPSRRSSSTPPSTQVLVETERNTFGFADSLTPSRAVPHPTEDSDSDATLLEEEGKQTTTTSLPPKERKAKLRRAHPSVSPSPKLQPRSTKKEEKLEPLSVILDSPHPTRMSRSQRPKMHWQRISPIRLYSASTEQNQGIHIPHPSPYTDHFALRESSDIAISNPSTTATSLAPPGVQPALHLSLPLTSTTRIRLESASDAALSGREEWGSSASRFGSRQKAEEELHHTAPVPIPMESATTETDFLERSLSFASSSSVTSPQPDVVISQHHFSIPMNWESSSSSEEGSRESVADPVSVPIVKQRKEEVS